ncbi:MAG: hypothetical protein JWQ63_1484 [Mucilaginibacter sp.]|nr:hypothetical protein [Mucilaginibacter sp.]
MIELMELLELKRAELANTIKILIYKQNPDLLKNLDLNNDDIFLEPLISGYFNYQNWKSDFPKEVLSELLIDKNDDFKKIQHLYNGDRIAYLPRIGYVDGSDNLSVEASHTIQNSSIEVLKYEVPLIRGMIHLLNIRRPIDDEDLLLDVSLYNKYINVLEEVFVILNNTSKNMVIMMNTVIKKIVFYQIKNKFGRSFSSINTSGLLYININTALMNETYFINELVITLNTSMFSILFHDGKNVFKLAYSTKISSYLNTNDIRDRNLFTLFSHFFTNSSSAKCLIQVYESTASNLYRSVNLENRIVFHLKKAMLDLDKIKAIINFHTGIEYVFNKEALWVYERTLDELIINLDKYESHFVKYNFDDFDNKNSFRDFEEG